jgi:peptidoglycan/LPS O-acetylase OafA/YrhL
MKEKLRFLDSLRGLAALYVVIGHARWLLWEGYTSGYLQHPEDYGLIEKFLVYFLSIFKFGHEAVIFFFVLSGFVIHLNYIDKLGQFSNFKNVVSNFYFKRFKRIYPVLIFALGLTFVCDQLILEIYPDLVEGSTNYETINEFISFNHSNGALASGILNLGGLGLPIFGSNGPLWSLSYEWWFYVIYPFVYFRIKNKSFGFYLVIFSLAIIAKLNMVDSIFFNKIFVGLASWALGCLLAEVYLQRIKMKLSQFIWGLSLLLLLNIYKPLFGHDFIVALAFTILLSVGLIYNTSVNRILKFKYLGDISYTLYIVHFPLLLLMSAFVLKLDNGFLPSHYFYSFIGIVLSLVLAFLISPFLEKKLPLVLENIKKKYEV